jgi:Ala-tRNA(Pro) deacylase
MEAAMIQKRLTEFLDSHHIKYVHIHHSPAFTAREVAVSAHLPFREVAKTVVLATHGVYFLAILPASEMIDLPLLRELLEKQDLRLASESELNALFPECEVGAMPPFGNLFQMDVIVSPPLTEDEEIAFNAGSHRDMVRMSYADYERLVDPKVLPFSTPRQARENLFAKGLS